MKKSIKLFSLLLALLLLLASCASNSDEGADTTEEETLFSEGRFDWGTAPPKVDNTDYNTYEYNFDIYALSASSRNVLTSKGVAAYRDLVDAIEKYRPSIEIDAADYSDVVLALLECYPPAALVSSLEFVPDKIYVDVPDETADTNPTDEDQEAESEEFAPIDVSGRIIISYYRTESEHFDALDRFYNGAAKILIDASSYESAEMRALALYTDCANKFPDVTGVALDRFDSLCLNSKMILDDLYRPSGASQNSIFHYLALQLGFDAAVIKGQLHGNEHLINALLLDGSWYYFDPSLEHSNTYGQALSFFGLNQASFIKEGFLSEHIPGADLSFKTGYSFTTPITTAPAIYAVSERFVPLRGSIYAAIDFETGIATLYTEEAVESTEFKFNTK